MSHPLFTAAILTLLGAFPATAQTLTDTELGIIGADLRFGFSNHASEGGSVSSTVDVAITKHHGLQFDLQYEERSNGGIGRFGTVLYMAPREGQKYGLSLMVADKNNKSSTYGQIGAVGMFALSDDVNAEVRAGIGLSTDNDLDWVTAGAGLHWQATENTRFSGHYDITEFDERNFSAVAHEVTFGVNMRISNTPSALFAEVSHDWLSGGNAAGGDTTLRAGVSFALGRSGNDQPSFRVSDPMRQLLRRGLY
ncbi:hypothetical protein [Sulfitobacter sp. SK011]|uniref:hypothetical protein n=1 Tax=Sulfitobacter sp. SK011 TaxID=1389004 RepID=UPI000E0A17B7|nr:hypothetical protein [Sulfitobacter sp. SK011]AXI42959.1 hypothetical protein C1J02_14225 [Sulfitobacter sp. SK011]